MNSRPVTIEGFLFQLGVLAALFHLKTKAEDQTEQDELTTEEWFELFIDSVRKEMK